MGENAYFLMVPFIDEVELDPFEFKLLAYIKRRAGTEKGSCYAQIDRMARESKMGHNTLRDALRGLEEKGRILITRQPGRTNLIRWLDVMPRNIECYRPTPTGSGTTPVPDQGHPPTGSGTTPVPDQGHKVDSSQVNTLEAGPYKTDGGSNGDVHGPFLEIMTFLRKSWADGGCGISANRAKTFAKLFTLSDLMILRKSVEEQRIEAKGKIHKPDGILAKMLDDGPYGIDITILRADVQKKAEEAAAAEKARMELLAKAKEEKEKREAEVIEWKTRGAPIHDWFEGLKREERIAVVNRAIIRNPKLTHYLTQRHWRDWGWVQAFEAAKSEGIDMTYLTRKPSAVPA
jgi:hypothetical protein